MKKSKKPFNLQERIFIQTSLEQGLSQREIARMLNRSEGGMSREILRGSFDGKYNAHKSQELCKERYISKTRIRKIFTAEEVAYIIKEKENGAPVSKIALDLKTHLSKVKNLLNQHGIDCRSESYIHRIYERIDALEEQVKILFETIKELTK
jgi:IS30 family transposase